MKRRLERQREQEWRREQQREQHHFRFIGRGVGLVDSAKEKKTSAVAEIYLNRGRCTLCLHPFDTSSPYDQTAGACVDPALACDRANLPVRHKGIGLPRHADVCFAAFVGGIELTVPRFGQRMAQFFLAWPST